MIQTELELIRTLIPSHLHRVTYIAGSAAIAPQTAKDVDVWVFASGCVLGELAEHMRAVWPTLVKMDSCIVRGNTSPLNATSLAAYGVENPERWVERGLQFLADIEVSGAARGIQFFGCVRGGIDSLLDGFDITTHQWALPLIGKPSSPICAASATLPSQLPRVTNFHTPVTTLGRLRRFLVRYGWDHTDHPDYTRLRDAAEEANAEDAFALAFAINPTHLASSPI